MQIIFATFFRNFCHQEVLKNAQSGHTANKFFIEFRRTNCALLYLPSLSSLRLRAKQERDKNREIIQSISLFPFVFPLSKMAHYNKRMFFKPVGVVCRYHVSSAEAVRLVGTHDDEGLRRRDEALLNGH